MPKESPPIAIASGQDEMVTLAVKNGWTCMTGLIENAEMMRKRFAQFASISKSLGKPTRRNKLTVSRYVHVGESVASARSEIRECVGVGVGVGARAGTRWHVRSRDELEGQGVGHRVGCGVRKQHFGAEKREQRRLARSLVPVEAAE